VDPETNPSAIEPMPIRARIQGGSGGGVVFARELPIKCTSADKERPQTRATCASIPGPARIAFRAANDASIHEPADLSVVSTKRLWPRQRPALRGHQAEVRGREHLHGYRVDGLGGRVADCARNAIAAANVVLVVIGPDWLRAHDESWRRRIDDPNDWVRREIELALRFDKPTLPVLVGDAAMPAERDLPREIEPIARRQALALQDEGWEERMVTLLERLQSHMSEANRTPFDEPSEPRGDRAIRSQFQATASQFYGASIGKTPCRRGGARQLGRSLALRGSPCICAIQRSR
jgi:hypothetical protein